MGPPQRLFVNPTAAHLRRQHQPQGIHQVAKVAHVHPLGQRHQIRHHHRLLTHRPKQRLQLIRRHVAGVGQ